MSPHRGTVLCAMVVALAACSSALPPPTASPGPIAAGPSREPPSLAVLPQEQAVLDAFMAGGVEIARVGGSKWEGQLGRVLPARVFIGRRIPPQQGGFGDGADVLFLPAGETWDIRVCETPGATAPWMLYEIKVNGSRVSGGEAATRIHHLVSDRFFAIAYTAESSDSLRRGLGVRPATC